MYSWWEKDVGIFGETSELLNARRILVQAVMTVHLNYLVWTTNGLNQSLIWPSWTSQLYHETISSTKLLKHVTCLVVRWTSIIRVVMELVLQYSTHNPEILGLLTFLVLSCGSALHCWHEKDFSIFLVMLVIVIRQFSKEYQLIQAIPLAVRWNQAAKERM